MSTDALNAEFELFNAWCKRRGLTVGLEARLMLWDAWCACRARDERVIELAHELAAQPCACPEEKALRCYACLAREALRPQDCPELAQ